MKLHIAKLGCDFCGKNQDEVDLLISGMNNTCICNECIELCGEIVAEKTAKSADEVAA